MACLWRIRLVSITTGDHPARLGLLHMADLVTEAAVWLTGGGCPQGGDSDQ